MGIVADDLTGATDSAVQFARTGWAARLALTEPRSVEPGSVVATVTDARAADPDTARIDTASAVRGLLAAGAENLFIKIDSTMRGTVIEQVNGALDGWSSEHPDAVAIVCSAYPAMGRTIEDGHILVNGAGVHTTAVGTDPVSPVSTSDLRELLPGSVARTLHAGPAQGNEAQRDEAQHNAAILSEAIAGGARIIAADASTDADLARLAEAIALLGTHAIPVGAAGLAVAMSRVWAAPASAASAGVAAKRVAVVVSSLHDVSRGQADHLLDAISGWVESQLSGPLPEVIVIASPSERPSREPEGASTAPELIARSLATITELVLAHDPVDTLMLLGGEGARAVLAKLGAESLLVHDAIREGIPLGTLEGGKADRMTVVTKAGGFGDPSTVHDIVTELLNSEGNAS